MIQRAQTMVEALEWIVNKAEHLGEAKRMATAALHSVPDPGRILEAREALEPFARTAANYDASLARTNQAAADEAKCTGGEYTAKSPIPDAHRVSVTMGDCRKAQRALAALRSAPDPGGIEARELVARIAEIIKSNAVIDDAWEGSSLRNVSALAALIVAALQSTDGGGQ